MLAGRPLGLIVRNVGRRENWAQLRAMARVYPAFAENVRRYMLGSGEYPYAPEVRTPLGTVRPRLESQHDLVTVNEIFCRLDYRVPGDVRTVVDIGSNIGISALYFLTRGPQVHCRLFEPVPANAARLRANLAGYEDRFALTEAAVWDHAGTVSFGLEPTGRYGGIELPTPDRIDVPCLDVNDVLAEVVAQRGRVDVLKVDTEGAEIATVGAIRPELLDHVGLILFETTERPVLHPERFDTSFAVDTARMVRRPDRPLASPRP